jgi:hypothetical protein
MHYWNYCVQWTDPENLEARLPGRAIPDLKANGLSADASVHFFQNDTKLLLPQDLSLQPSHTSQQTATGCSCLALVPADHPARQIRLESNRWGLHCRYPQIDISSSRMRAGRDKQVVVAI